MSIKKIISALLVLPVLTAASCVCAEDERFAISDLKVHTMERWEETYQAYGRTIDVNVPIQVPETDCVQVYIVEPMPLLTEEKQNEIKKAYEQPKNSSMRYEFRNKKYQTLMVHAYLSGSESENATQSASKLLQYEINSAYAENNDLSVQSALQVTQSKVQEVYADVNISLRDIVLYGCFYQKGPLSKSQKKGIIT